MSAGLTFNNIEIASFLSVVQSLGIKSVERKIKYASEIWNTMTDEKIFIESKLNFP